MNATTIQSVLSKPGRFVLSPVSFQGEWPHGGIPLGDHIDARFGLVKEHVPVVAESWGSTVKTMRTIERARLAVVCRGDGSGSFARLWEDRPTGPDGLALAYVPSDPGESGVIFRSAQPSLSRSSALTAALGREFDWGVVFDFGKEPEAVQLGRVNP